MLDGIAEIFWSLVIIAFLGICYAIYSFFAPVKIKSENLVYDFELERLNKRYANHHKKRK